MKNKIFLTILPFVLLISCYVTDSAENNKINQLFDDFRKEIWDTTGDPSNLGLGRGYNYNYSELPKSGQAEHETWAGWYWATYKDAINYKWAGENTDSPTSKYAKAFGINPQALEDAVSSRSGIDSQINNRACTKNSDCTDLKNGSVCAKRSGEDKGYCIPTWFGQCHAWAPAAVMEKEPKHPVKVNGVTFEPQDIKALLTYVYNNVRTNFLGARCNADEDDIKFDEHGRPLDMECRDVNPGAMHVILTNWLGIHKKSFIEDRTYDDEVWNQPVRGFQVIVDKEITKSQASKLLGDRAYFDKKAVSFKNVVTDVNYITESRPTENGNLNEDRYTLTDRLSYILELDRNGKIIGGEWRTQKLHPDFFWAPTATAGDYKVGNFTFEYAKIKDLLNKSLDDSNTTSTDNTTISVENSKTRINTSGSIERNQWKYYGPYKARKKFKAKLSGDKRIKLYVKLGSKPATDSYDCLSTQTSSSSGSCNVQGNGNFYVALQGVRNGKYNLALLFKED